MIMLSKAAQYGSHLLRPTVLTDKSGRDARTPQLCRLVMSEANPRT